MNDLLLLATLGLVSGGLGLAAARLLPLPAFEWRILAAPTFGTCVLAVVVTAGYRFGLSPGAALLGSAAAAALALAAEARAAGRGRGLLADAGARRALAVGGIAWAAVTAVLVAPRFVGGDQLTVFQGNQWDTFGYLGSALVYAREPYAAVAAATAREFLENPLVHVAQVNLSIRPTAHLLYAAFSRVAPADAYRLHYTFLVFFFSQAALVAAVLLRAWLPAARPALVLAVASIFALGFWGQYVLDINAWSQAVSTPVLLLLCGLLLEVGGGPRAGPAATAALAGAIAVLSAGTIYVYPESLTYHLAIFGPLAVAAIALRQIRARRWSLAPYAPLLGVAGAAAGVLCWKATLGVVVSQVGSTLGQPVPWWRFFQAFFFGRDGLPRGEGIVAAGVDFAAGFLGLFFATPPPDLPAAAAWTWRLALVAALAALIAAAARVLAGEREPPGGAPRVPPEGLSRLRLAAIAWALLLVPAAALASRGHYWQAGKAVSYAAPLSMLLLGAPLAAGARSLRAPARWVTAAFVAFQLGTGLLRVAAAASPSGIHYERPYPAVQDEALKEALRWDIEPLAGALAGARRVLVAPMNPWSAHWVMCFLEARGIDFTMVGQIVGNFGAGEVLGTVSAPPPADALVSLAHGGFLVQYADGRPPARVAWSGQVR